MYRIYSCISRPFMTKRSAQKFSLDFYTSHRADIFLRASLLFTVLNFRFFIARKLRKARGVILVTSTLQIRSLVTKFSKMVVFLSSDPSKLFSVSSVF